MDKNTRSLLTIITEMSLEKTLTKELQELGALGYTITNARGRGSRGARRSDWDVESNIRIEIVCTEVIAQAIAKRMQEKYYDNFGMIIFSNNVSVLRADKF
ncbi:MAG: nitrogen regulatory protein PII [Cocleimonas sp.]|jgi:nitrogen regulatory protein PII